MSRRSCESEKNFVKSGGIDMKTLAGWFPLIFTLGGCAAQAEDGSRLAPDCGAYLYRADIVRVIDGDTVVADIDLGFRTWRRGEHLRLYGIDAPETTSEAGLESTKALKKHVEGKRVYICTIKAKRSEREATGSFGRFLAVIYDDGKNINDWMVHSGAAVAYRE